MSTDLEQIKNRILNRPMWNFYIIWFLALIAFYLIAVTVILGGSGLSKLSYKQYILDSIFSPIADNYWKIALTSGLLSVIVSLLKRPLVARFIILISPALVVIEAILCLLIMGE